MNKSCIFGTMNEQLKYQIALTLVPGVGDVLGKKLVAYCGGAEAVFLEKKSSLEKIPGIGSKVVANILQQQVLSRAEEEIAFIEKHDIQPFFYLDKAYPKRLQQCADGPIMLYYKGNVDLNHERIIGVVGTRNATTYGKQLCEQIAEQLSDDKILVVSGLAYGIDSFAHRAALKSGLPTVGVLAHGLDRLYPAQNKQLADKMLGNGGLLTEFLTKTNPDRENFPRRNRIVAGMIDALIVVESASRGGALITAEIANSYNRDVFAVPGKVGDTYSEGCNYLIRTNRAHLMEKADHLRYIMRWDDKPKAIQMQIFRNFTEEETLIMNVFGDETICSIDEMIVKTDLTTTKIASILLSLEFDGMLLALPGKRYQKL